jgi:hypothetical protein
MIKYNTHQSELISNDANKVSEFLNDIKSKVAKATHVCIEDILGFTEYVVKQNEGIYADCTYRTLTQSGKKDTLELQVRFLSKREKFEPDEEFPYQLRRDFPPILLSVNEKGSSIICPMYRTIELVSYKNGKGNQDLLFAWEGLKRKQQLLQLANEKLATLTYTQRYDLLNSIMEHKYKLNGIVSLQEDVRVGLGQEEGNGIVLININSENNWEFDIITTYSSVMGYISKWLDDNTQIVQPETSK